MTNINDNPAYEKDGQGNFTHKGWLDRERDRTVKNCAYCGKPIKNLADALYDGEDRYVHRECEKGVL